MLSAIQELLDTPLPVEPTLAHFAAARAFPVIITTNYDLLFERACGALNLDYIAHTPASSDPSRKAAVTIFKIDGSITDPDSVVLTDKDHYRVQAATAFWTTVESVLQKYRVVVVGHSIRDVTSRRLLASRNLDLPGVYVSPILDDLDEVLLHHYHLEGVKANADEYMTSVLGLDAAPTNNQS